MQLDRITRSRIRKLWSWHSLGRREHADVRRPFRITIERGFAKLQWPHTQLWNWNTVASRTLCCYVICASACCFSLRCRKNSDIQTLWAGPTNFRHCICKETTRETLMVELTITCGWKNWMYNFSASYRGIYTLVFVTLCNEHDRCTFYCTSQHA